MLTHEDGRLGLEARRVEYDTEGYLRATLETDMPHARWWADCWLTPRGS
jgi:hypothetical protein